MTTRGKGPAPSGNVTAMRNHTVFGLLAPAFTGTAKSRFLGQSGVTLLGSATKRAVQQPVPRNANANKLIHPDFINIEHTALGAEALWSPVIQRNIAVQW